MASERMYVGTYTRSGKSEGIHVFGRHPASEKLDLLQVVPEVDPSFLAFDPSRRFLFAVSEGLGRDNGHVASFAIDQQSGELTPLSRQASEGGEPCHLCTDPSGRWLLVANHEHGSVAVLPIGADGHLGRLTDLRQHHGSGPGPTQQGPHAHHVTFDPAGERVLVADKGIDQVVVYRLDTHAGKLVPNAPFPAGRLHPGAAPRHVAFHPDGQHAYVNGEADMTVSTCTYDQRTGELLEVQSLSTVPTAATGQRWSTAEIAVEPSGAFVYVSNRGHDSIAMFGVDRSTGRLSALGHVATQGRTPRNFSLDPSGTRVLVANQDSDTIVQFEIDAGSGQLLPTGDVIQVGAPVCIIFG